MRASCTAARHGGVRLHPRQILDRPAATLSDLDTVAGARRRTRQAAAALHGAERLDNAGSVVAASCGGDDAKMRLRRGSWRGQAPLAPMDDSRAAWSTMEVEMHANAVEPRHVEKVLGKSHAGKLQVQCDHGLREVGKDRRW